MNFGLEWYVRLQVPGRRGSRRRRRASRTQEYRTQEAHQQILVNGETVFRLEKNQENQKEVDEKCTGSAHSLLPQLQFSESNTHSLKLWGHYMNILASDGFFQRFYSEFINHQKTRLCISENYEISLDFRAYNFGFDWNRVAILTYLLVEHEKNLQYRELLRWAGKVGIDTKEHRKMVRTAANFAEQ